MQVNLLSDVRKQFCVAILYIQMHHMTLNTFQHILPSHILNRVPTRVFSL